MLQRRFLHEKTWNLLKHLKHLKNQFDLDNVHQFLSTLSRSRSSHSINLQSMFDTKMRDKGFWDVPASDLSKRCRNPIRRIVEQMNLSPNPNKPMIALSVGDPTVYNNLQTTHEVTEALIDSVRSNKFNGYAPSIGYLETRKALCDHLAKSGQNIDPKDVILCSGCSSALEMCISVIANPGQNILIPKPAFPIYKNLAEAIGIHCRYYNLLADRQWEVDLHHLESLIDSNTSAIVINNPSNPCGSVFTKQHILDILSIASRNFVPIIADEIYEHFVFKSERFHSLSSLSTDVPILSCSGLTKRFLVPGWRFGWITINDRHDVFQHEVTKGLIALSQRIMGCNTLVQGALEAILTNTPQSFFDETISVVETNAKLTYNILSQVPGLKPIMPSGAMYMMVAINVEMFPEFKSDLEFVERLIFEESVFCLPGEIFELPGYVRLVLTLPEVLMTEACNRMRQFCENHFCAPAYRPAALHSDKCFHTHDDLNQAEEEENIIHDISTSENN